MQGSKSSVRKAERGYIVENSMGRETVCKTFEEAVTVLLRQVDPWLIRVGQKCEVTVAVIDG